MIRPGILGVLYKGVLSTYTVQVYRRIKYVHCTGIQKD